MSSNRELLAQAEHELVRYLARTGSLDDSLFHVLVRIRLVLESYEVATAQIEIAEYQPSIH